MSTPSSSSSDDSSYLESEYPTVSLGRKASRTAEVSRRRETTSNSRSSSSRHDQDDDSSSSRSTEPQEMREVCSTRGRGTKRSGGEVRTVARKKNINPATLAEWTADDINIYKPDECMKYMILELDQSLYERFCSSDLGRELKEAGTRFTTSSDVDDPGLVLWSRVVSQTFIRSGNQIRLMPKKRRCDLALYVCSAEEVSEYVTAETLAEFVTAKRKVAQASMSLVIYGLNDYFKSAARKNNQRSSRNKIMSPKDLEMSIADVLVTTECDVIKVNTPDEMTATLVRLTKAIAEAPYKISKRSVDDQAAFYMKGDNRNCVVVDKDGTGLSRLWQQMLAILPLSSLEIARALTEKYKSPHDFYEAVSKPDGVKVLAELGVTRATVPGAKHRRIGPEYARKLHLLFTAQDGNIIIG